VDTDKGLARATPMPHVERRAPPPEGFAGFFRTGYRELLKTALYAGATRHEADEASAVAMSEVLRRWGEIDNPLAYARRAVVSNFIKEKTRDLDRVRRRQVERSAGTADGREDPDLTVWEDREWVMQMLLSLPAGQRNVMAFIVDGFAPIEIAALLGRSPAAIRQSLHDARRRLIEALQREQAAEQAAPARIGPARKGVR
jgi:DNA-directed RNA polymerase specialized sigma24 family protein